jgi:very-short-patch-repair endonuclease
MQEREVHQEMGIHRSQLWGTLTDAGHSRTIDDNLLYTLMPKDSPRIRGTTHKTEQAARHLRQHLTPAEAQLWSVLRGRQLAGLKFRCQHPVGRFIVDFYCPSCKLVIEVDGAIHTQQLVYDEARTEQLRSFGYRVLRFTNEEVLNDLQTVIDRITKIAKAQFPSELGHGVHTRDQL